MSPAYPKMAIATSRGGGSKAEIGGPEQPNVSEEPLLKPNFAAWWPRRYGNVQINKGAQKNVKRTLLRDVSAT